MHYSHLSFTSVFYKTNLVNTPCHKFNSQGPALRILVSGSQFPSPRDPVPWSWISGSQFQGPGCQGPVSQGPRAPGSRVSGSQGLESQGLGSQGSGSQVLILDCPKIHLNTVCVYVKKSFN